MGKRRAFLRRERQLVAAAVAWARQPSGQAARGPGSEMHSRAGDSAPVLRLPRATARRPCPASGAAAQSWDSQVQSLGGCYSSGAQPAPDKNGGCLCLFESHAQPPGSTLCYVSRMSCPCRRRLATSDVST